MANILITCPTMNIHGGIRVLVEWANHLSRHGHNVTFQIMQPAGYRWKHWIDIDQKVRILVGLAIGIDYDIIVASTPSIANALNVPGILAKRFYLLQMAEHLFNDNKKWHEECYRSYKVEFPIIGISKWVEDEVRKWRGNGLMYYVGNGVSDDFMPGQKDEGLTILVEGWGGYNAAKDVDLLAPRVAEVLHKEYGAKIVAFSQFPLSFHHRSKQYEYILSEYHEAPSGEDLVRLYQRATFMLKASKYDARSCAPVEAMKCGTITVRAIGRGDDDLNTQNSIVCEYDYDEFLQAAKMACKAALNNTQYWQDLHKNGLEYAANYLDWKNRIIEIENILLNG